MQRYTRIQRARLVNSVVPNETSRRRVTLLVPTRVTAVHGMVRILVLDFQDAQSP